MQFVRLLSGAYLWTSGRMNEGVTTELGAPRVAGDCQESREVVAGGDVPRPAPAISIRTAADVVAEPVPWLWKERLALGKIAVVAGAANVGKSLRLCPQPKKTTATARWGEDRREGNTSSRLSSSRLPFAPSRLRGLALGRRQTPVQ
jgi:hypothetical protein